MLAQDEDALICDMAETYHIFDMSQVPLPLRATLAAGLGPDSRIGRALSGVKLDGKAVLLAAILDGVNALIWMQTKDGHKNRNRPASVLKRLTEPPAKKQEIRTFASGEDFMKELERIRQGERHG